MPSKAPTEPAPAVANALRLALRPSEAARALGISERLLWSLTNRGEIPHVRLGERRVLYAVSALEAWLASKSEGGVK